MMKIFILIALYLFSLPIYSQSPKELEKDWKEAVSNSSRFNMLKQERPLVSIGSTNLRLEIECKREWGCQGGEKDWFQKESLKKVFG